MDSEKQEPIDELMRRERKEAEAPIEVKGYFTRRRGVPVMVSAHTRKRPLPQGGKA